MNDDVVDIRSSDALKMSAFEGASGDVIWEYITGGWSWGTPAVIGGAAYIGGLSAFPYYFEGVTLEAGIYSVYLQTGEESWRLETEPVDGYVTGGVFASPEVSNYVVYVSAIDGMLYAIEE